MLKVKAALAARTDPSFVFIARTDALQPNGWEDAVDRAKAYRDAGADLVFVDGLKDRESIEKAAEALRGIPQVLNNWLISPEEAQGLGFALYIHIGTMFRHFAAFRDSLNELHTTGAIALNPEDARVGPITELLERRD